MTEICKNRSFSLFDNYFSVWLVYFFIYQSKKTSYLDFAYSGKGPQVLIPIFFKVSSVSQYSL